MINKYYVLICIFLFTTAGYSQYNGKSFLVGVSGIYTSSAKIYLYPNSSDAILRNTSFPLSDIYDAGIYFRYRLTDDILLGLSTEYMRKTATGNNLTVFANNQTVTINVQDGFTLIPVELSIYYLIPFSTEKFKFLMGGGGAYYYGTQIRNFGNADIKSSESKIAYGIQVSISMDYLLTNNFIISGAMKFRDPQFSVINTYNRKIVNYRGNTIELAQSSFNSKINVDGVTFLISMAYAF